MEEVENKYGLKIKTVEEISQIFNKHDYVTEAIVFGSRAMGNYRESSDIDIALRGRVSFDNLVKIESEIDQLMLPYKFDILSYNTIKNEELISHINTYGKILFSRK